MAGLDRTLRVLDALGLFIVTRFPFIELFMLLMSTGEKAESLPGGQIFTFRDTLRQEYVLVYANAAVFFLCGTGMTLDFKRRKCGFAAALHAVIYTTMTLFQRKSDSEYFIVSITRPVALILLSLFYIHVHMCFLSSPYYMLRSFSSVWCAFVKPRREIIHFIKVGKKSHVNY